MLTQSVLLTLASGLLFPLALPNEIFGLGSPILGLVALTPFYLAIRGTPSARRAGRLGALFGGVSTLIANYWLMFFGDYSVWTIGGTTIGYIGYNWVLAGFLWKATRSRPAYRPALFAGVWMVYELAKSVGFLAYPWGLAAYPLNDVLVVNQIVDVTGVWSLSFLVVYANASLAELLVPDDDICSRRVVASGKRLLAPAMANVAMVAVLAVLVAGYGVARMRSDIPVRDTVDLVLVQQNADAWNTRNIALPLLAAQRETGRALEDATVEPELIVWSETSLRYFYVEGGDWYARNPPEEPFLEFVAQLPAPLLTGSPFSDPTDDEAVYNAVLEIARDTTVTDWYGKQHLVPFAEAIPFWDLEAVRSFFARIVGVGSTWTHGPGPRLFTVEGNAGTPVRIATPICFEDGFAYVNRRFVREGADLILNLTNNAWSRTDSAQLQHFVAARYRAIETRLGLVRSTNSGYTSVVDAHGRITDELPMFDTGHLVTTVPVYASGQTLYVRWGEWLPVLALIVLAGLFAADEFRGRAARRSGRRLAGAPGQKRGRPWRPSVL